MLSASILWAYGDGLLTSGDGHDDVHLTHDGDAVRYEVAAVGLVLVDEHHTLHC